MRISDWSSDVCSSDLRRATGRADMIAQQAGQGRMKEAHRQDREQPGEERRHLLRSEERRVGKGVSVRVDLGGRRIIQKTKRRALLNKAHEPPPHISKTYIITKRNVEIDNRQHT